MYFVLVFDRSEGRLLSLSDLTDSQAALSERFAAERRHQGNPDVEIVVLGAASRNALRQTHARYFNTVSALARDASRRVFPGAAAAALDR